MATAGSGRAWLAGLTAVPIAVLLVTLFAIVASGAAILWAAEVDGARVMLAALRSLGMVLLAISMAFPIGFATAVASHELDSGAAGSGVNRLLSGMASLPSIVYAMALGPTMLLSWHTPGFLAASVIIAIATIPFIYVACREALATVPRATREAAIALGGSPWRNFRTVVLPAALPFLATGWILSVARIIGEAAILVAIAAFLTKSQSSEAVSTLPMLLVEELGSRHADLGTTAAALAILFALILALNGAAIYLRGFRSNQ